MHKALAPGEPPLPDMPQVLLSVVTRRHGLGAVIRRKHAFLSSGVSMRMRSGAALDAARRDAVTLPLLPAPLAGW